MNIGIMGGTFDPVHNGHLYIASEACRQVGLDEVWWIPSGNPPHKGQTVSNRISRYEMCALATASNPKMVLKDFEMNRAGNCYTWELLEHLAHTYPRDRFFFIMGEDSLELFPEWVHPERIARNAALLVCVRYEGSREHAMRKIRKQIETVTNRFDASITLLETRNIPISSTELRARIRAEETVRDLIPSVVEKYITEHELYRKDIPSEFVEELVPKLQKELRPHRFWHTVGVMETSASLAARYDYPIQKARLAGLLHDCAKGYNEKELRRFCAKHHIPVTDAEERSPHLLHGKVGAYLAEHTYGITDKKILHAIAVHTTGSVGMGLLDKIIFVADYIEPNRNRAAHLAELRRMSMRDLDVTALMILQYTIDYLKKKKQPMDERTIDTFHYMEDYCTQKGVLWTNRKQKR